MDAGVIYLSGAVHAGVREFGARSGFMLTPMMGNAPDLAGITWAADTGCFAAPEKFRLTEYLVWLWQRRQHAARCLFATAPDVWGDGLATLAKSRPALPLLRELGYAAALVAQPGLTPALVPWDEIDALFVGGPDDWQRGPVVAALVDEARRRGKWCHRGRVNSLKRLRASVVAGYDSADGTYLAFGPDTNLPKLRGWLEALERQPSLWEAAS